MVDVGDKDTTRRMAVAGGRIVMQPETLQLIMQAGHKTGAVLGIARVAGIMAAKRTAELVLTVVEATTTLHTGITPYQPNYPVAVLWIVVDFLLATLLILRSRAGRIWTQGIVLIHVLYLGHVLVISHPALWLYMGALGRARVAGTLLLDVAAFFWLFTYQAKSYLDR